MSPERKIFLVYLMLKCDNGGVIDLDFEDVEFWIGKKIGDPLQFLPEGYLILIHESGKYFMPKFIEWQYPNFPYSKVHQQAQAKEILIKNEIFDIDNQCIKLPNNYLKVGQSLGNSYPHANGNANGYAYGNAKKDKDKEQFEIFREQYPGNKRGIDIEFNNLIKKHKDWKDIIPILSEKITYQIQTREKRKNAGGFIPEWKNLQTWINQRCWEEIISLEIISKQKDNLQVSTKYL